MFQHRCQKEIKIHILKQLFQIYQNTHQTTIVIKSTVLPSVLEVLCKNNKNIVYNRNFSEKRCEDFINSEMIILGGDKVLCNKLLNYKNNSCCKTDKYLFVDAITASLINLNKYFSYNKSSFFNELFSLFNQYETSDSWEDVISSIANDSRIGTSHMNVPAMMEGKALGSMFPRIRMLYLKGQRVKVTLEVLRSAINRNNKIRKEYPDLIGREHDQDTFLMMFEDL